MAEEVEATPEAAAPAPEGTAAPSTAAALAPEDNAAEPAAAAPAPEAASPPAAGSPRGYRASLERSVYHLGELPVRRVPLTATGAPTAASPPAVEQRVGSDLLGAPQLSRPASRARTGGSGRVRSRCSAPNQRSRHAEWPRPKLWILRHFNTQAKPKKRKAKPKPKPPSPAVPHVSPKAGPGSPDRHSGPGPGTYHDGLARGIGATKPSGTVAWSKWPSSPPPRCGQPFGHDPPAQLYSHAPQGKRALATGRLRQRPAPCPEPDLSLTPPPLT